MKKWLSFTVIALMSVFVLAACGTSDSDKKEDKNASEGEKTYKIGATQIVEHPSLDAAYEGFKEAIKDKGLDVEYDFQSAQSDLNNVSTISQNFVADKVDLIFANSTPSALGALQATSDIPIVFTSVTDAVEGGLVKSKDDQDGNITGVLDLHPDAIKSTVEFIDKYFKDSKVGVIYNAGEQNSVIQIDAVKKAVKGTSLEILERTVATSAEVQQAATTLVGKADVIYIVTDNTVVSALDSVVGIANDHALPLFVGEPDSLAGGGFATYGIDYHTIGYRSGEMAAEILTGEKSIKDLPIEQPKEIQLFINKEAAKAQGIKWNKEWDDKAEFIEKK